ncbi:MAG: MerR family transcriptional regulator [Bacillota bacterium]|nr:MerR family transcriptional regulator [Bacillota bacterium]
MLYQIGDFSKISRLSIKTLRFYHECSLLVPTEVDEETGYRYYDEKCLEKAKTINSLKELEFSLSEIKMILENYSDDEDITDFMERKSKEISTKLKKYEEIQEKLNRFKKQEEGNGMSSSSGIVVKNIPDMLIAAIRYVGWYDEVGKEIGRLFKYCGRYAAGKCFCLYYDREYKEDNAEMDICVQVSREVNNEVVSSRILRGGKAISTTYTGPYEEIGEAYKKLIDYINENNIKDITPSREIYVKGPGMIFRGNPNNYITEIQIMIEEE